VPKNSTFLLYLCYTLGKKGKVIPLHTMEVHGVRKGIAPTYSLPRHLMGVSDQHHAPAALYPQGTPDTHCTGGWVGPRVGLDAEARGKILCRGSNPGRLVRSQTLYWLSYPGSLLYYRPMNISVQYMHPVSQKYSVHLNTANIFFYMKLTNGISFMFIKNTWYAS
jgi:hypothetical protein